MQDDKRASEILHFLSTLQDVLRLHATEYILPSHTHICTVCTSYPTTAHSGHAPHRRHSSSLHPAEPASAQTAADSALRWAACDVAFGCGTPAIHPAADLWLGYRASCPAACPVPSANPIEGRGVGGARPLVIVVAVLLMAGLWKEQYLYWVVRRLG
eukprot:scaffold255549_cov17-Tisochrysis_lutea.AAC.1